ncbi:hypothetical protein [Ulvibacter litoralis]|uniref:Uncharacterized protein n=1 Tax=Ulvibacter litoralis TaxID=227084 RepID=A0A1G7I5X2_9FLAO|nr:hypothetical protein [Ulvibacter litoralis]GHC62405.1 hypothetical protein GCM10008083_29430 [Ulvibacter litoralis]SDF08105.1 hypothetical protein SAMN05421855_105111 [Ulvibacter litoralis]
MKTSQTDIYNHDTDIDVTHKINTIELDNWMNHLRYIKKELKNLIGLYGDDLSAKIDSEDVLMKLQKKDTENDNLLHALQKYMSSRRDIIECEDTQCDMAYITEHESYRRSYLYHLDKYRRIKDEFFSKIQGSFKIRSIS